MDILCSFLNRTVSGNCQQSANWYHGQGKSRIRSYGSMKKTWTTRGPTVVMRFSYSLRGNSDSEHRRYPAYAGISLIPSCMHNSQEPDHCTPRMRWQIQVLYHLMWRRKGLTFYISDARVAGRGLSQTELSFPGRWLTRGPHSEI
jgi:hypothetical protein